MDPLLLGAVIGVIYVATRPKGATTTPSEAPHGGGGASEGGAALGNEPAYGDASTSTHMAVTDVAAEPGTVASAHDEVTGAPTTVGHDGAGVVVTQETGSSGITPTEPPLNSIYSNPYTNPLSLDVVGVPATTKTNIFDVGRVTAASTTTTKATSKATCACIKPPCTCGGSPKPSVVQSQSTGRSSVNVTGGRPLPGPSYSTSGVGILSHRGVTSKDHARALEVLGPKVGSVW